MGQPSQSQCLVDGLDTPSCWGAREKEEEERGVAGSSRVKRAYLSR